MLHSISFRVIGQSIEVAKLPSFELELDGPNYLVTSDSLTPTGEWVLRHALSRNDFSAEAARPSAVTRSVRFTSFDISRLDEQAQMQRRNKSSTLQDYRRLSQLLRTLGDHLDRMNVRAFQISWAADSASVDFQLPDGQIDSRTFTAEKLQQLGSSSRFRRSSPTGSDLGSRDFPKPTRPRNR